MILTVFLDFLGEQGAEDFGHRDGDVHRHVLSLPADQDHEECPLAGRQVRTENTEIFTQHQYDKTIVPAESCSYNILEIQLCKQFITFAGKVGKD